MKKVSMRERMIKTNCSVTVRVISAVLIVCTALTGIAFQTSKSSGASPVSHVTAAEKKTITLEEYLELLMPLYGKSEGVDAFTDAYYQDVITIDDFEIAEKPIRRGKAALIAKAVYQKKYGENYNKKKFNAVLEEKRIIGLSNNTVEERNAIRMCYVYGLMVGESRGPYTNSRSIQGDGKLTVKEANTIARRIKDKSKCRKISPDGRLIRTTNLPKNHKHFNYIFASYPNKFYEKKFRHQNATFYYKPEEGRDYTTPKTLLKYKYKTDSRDQNMDEAIERLEKNLELRLNFDYRTVNSGWITELKNTYAPIDNTWESTLRERVVEQAKSYVRKAKSNRVIVSSKEVVVDPTTLYGGRGAEYIVRCHAKIKVQATNIPQADADDAQNILIYTTDLATIYLPGLKNNEWYDIVFDIIFSKSIREGWYISNDSICYNK